MRQIIYSLLCLACVTTFGQQHDEASRRRNFNLVNDVAMREFDPVSYFQNKPTKGSSQFEYKYKGVSYFFVSAANRDEFIRNPGRYEPAYGGWCAYTIALNGERVKIQPTSYKIIQDRLYLFYNFNNDNRLMKWVEGDQKKLLAAADQNWLKKMH